MLYGDSPPIPTGEGRRGVFCGDLFMGQQGTNSRAGVCFQ